MGATGGGSGTGPTGASEGGATTVEVAIEAFAYGPVDVRIGLGSTVRWTNQDPAPHTATGDGFDTGTLERGMSGSHTFDEPGTYAYRCTIHPAMQATVVVGPD